MSNEDETIIQRMKTVYTDPIILLTMLFGFILMQVAGSLIGAVFIIVGCTAYMLVTPKFRGSQD